MKHITQMQRYEISTYLKCKKTKTFIAKALNLHKSTVCREINRNSSKTGKYNPVYAQELSNERKERFGRKRKFTIEVESFVVEKIEKEQWSPKQITGYCTKHSLTICNTLILPIFANYENARK